jgi:hypothetical protein
VEWTKESDTVFGNISIFPTLFLIDRKGMITRLWIGLTGPEELRRAVAKTLEDTRPAS